MLKVILRVQGESSQLKQALQQHQSSFSSTRILAHSLSVPAILSQQNLLHKPSAAVSSVLNATIICQEITSIF